jgi:hypothetical protein
MLIEFAKKVLTEEVVHLLVLSRHTPLVINLKVVGVENVTKFSGVFRGKEIATKIAS